MSNILVISPHPDDEAIGCGGTIAWHVCNGDVVHCIFLTSGEKGGHGKSEEETREAREQEAKDAAVIFNIAQTEFWRQPDGGFEATGDNIKRLTEKIKQFKPAIIYVPHENEMHTDHKAACLLAEQALRNVHAAAEKPDVYMYEVWTPLQQTDLIRDISEHVEVKRKAIRAHKCQCEVMDFDEAILGLNRYRGEMLSWPGGDYAEVFKKMNITK